MAGDWLAASLPQEMLNGENLTGFRYQYTLSDCALKRSGFSIDGRARSARIIGEFRSMAAQFS
ncbi:MAG: hypothetical protein OXE52_12655 [Chloroflexi bacterium]|nr:hypothetical protein [Chloroflexota bacterium]